MTNSNLSVRHTSVKPSAVRQWARENGLPVGSRGKFDPSVIRAYNAENKGSRRYVQAGYKTQAVKEVKFGKSVRKVSVPAARELLKQAGEPIGKRGRISAAQAQRALELSKQD